MKKILLLVWIILTWPAQAAILADNAFIIKQCEKVAHELTAIRDAYVDDDDYYCADLIDELVIPVLVAKQLLIEEKKMERSYTKLINDELNQTIKWMDRANQSYCKHKKRLNRAKNSVLLIKNAVSNR